MQMSRWSTFPSYVVMLACLAAPVLDASAAEIFPDKPIRMVVGFGTGGSADVLARLLAPKLSEQLGQPMVVENRPGASGAIATERVATAPGDGYTLLLMTVGDTVIPALRIKLPYDLERDFAAVSLVMSAPFVLVVHPSVPALNVTELIALARSQPGKLSFGSVGVGSSPHLMAELLNLMAKVKTVHVPYKSGAENVIAVASGQIEMYFSSVASLLPLLEARRIRPLALSSAKRASFMSSIPTLHESGLAGYDRAAWQGVIAPASVPKDIVARLNATIGKVVNAPDMKESLLKQGLEPQTDTPEQFAAFIRAEVAANANLIRFIGLKPE